MSAVDLCAFYLDFCLRGALLDSYLALLNAWHPINYCRCWSDFAEGYVGDDGRDRQHRVLQPLGGSKRSPGLRGGRVRGWRRKKCGRIPTESEPMEGKIRKCVMILNSVLRRNGCLVCT